MSLFKISIAYLFRQNCCSNRIMQKKLTKSAALIFRTFEETTGNIPGTDIRKNYHTGHKLSIECVRNVLVFWNWTWIHGFICCSLLALTTEIILRVMARVYIMHLLSIATYCVSDNNADSWQNFVWLYIACIHVFEVVSKISSVEISLLPRSSSSYSWLC